MVVTLESRLKRSTVKIVNSVAKVKISLNGKTIPGRARVRRSCFNEVSGLR